MPLTARQSGSMLALPPPVCILAVTLDTKKPVWILATARIRRKSNADCKSALGVLVEGSPRGLVVFEWCAPRAEWFVERRARSRFVTVNAVLLTVRFVEQSSRVLCTFGIVFVSMRRFAGMARFAAWQAASAISSSAHFCIRGRGGL